MGADKLLGNGDMLFLWLSKTSTLVRGQGTFLGDDENGKGDGNVKHGQNFVNELVNLKVEDPEDAPTNAENLRKRDDLYEMPRSIVSSAMVAAASRYCNAHWV